MVDCDLDGCCVPLRLHTALLCIVQCIEHVADCVQPPSHTELFWSLEGISIENIKRNHALWILGQLYVHRHSCLSFGCFLCSGGYHGSPPLLVSPLDAMRTAWGGGDRVRYAVGCNVSYTPENFHLAEASIAAAVDVAKDVDVVVLGLGLCGDNYGGTEFAVLSLVSTPVKLPCLKIAMNTAAHCTSFLH
eukprot:m.1102525 g.1102525  ORF g.1102525 m.1102525 type:complete len:190 (-) comp24326_c0_seq86:1524-2093(-)